MTTQPASVDEPEKEVPEEDTDVSKKPPAGLKGPGFPDSDDEVTCPSCGRFAGTYERCPYCGANMNIRLSVRVLRRLCVVVAFVGIFAIWMAARHMEVPLFQVGNFTPTMNFAILRVRGEIVSGPYYGDRGDSFYVGLDDGSGRINIKAYGRTALGLRAVELQRGDRIEAQGSIRMQAGKNPTMSLRVRRDLTLIHRSARKPDAPRRRTTEITPLSSITRDMAADKVKLRVKGKVRRRRDTDWGRGFTLDDGKATLAVWLFSRELERMGDSAELLANGKTIEMVGRLEVYTPKGGGKERIQFRPFGRSDAVEEAAGDPTPDPGASAPAPRSGASLPAPGNTGIRPEMAPGLDEVGRPAGRGGH